MSMIRLWGNVDENGQLSAQVPTSICPGPVMVFVLSESGDDGEARLWTEGVAKEWADELSDTAQDIYTLADGEPVREP